MLGERAALDNQRFIFWFGPVASAGEAMVWESETDGNPSVDADELPTDKVTEPHVRHALNSSTLFFTEFNALC
jgi:hypothetical protein